MNKLVLGLALTLATIVGPVRAAPFEELTHFVPIAGAPPPSADSKIEVYEFFMWTCPHCMRFEPYLQKWLARKPADVAFGKVPAIFNPASGLLARAFYALEALGELDRLNDAFFNALVNDHRRLDSEQAITAFVNQFGVDEAKFREAFNSFAVAAKVRRAEQLADRYKITSVPKLVVDGRNKTGDGLGSYEQMLEVTDFLVGEGRKLRQPEAATR
jgi:protein dithiol oxidoreductase (disulfide-forming)